MANHSLAKNTSFLYIRMVVVLGISLFTTRLILQNLGIEDYGIYNVVGSIVSLFTFLQTAISSANYRYLAFAIGKDDEVLLAKTFRSAATLGISIAVIVVLIAETAGLFYINNYLNVPPERFTAASITFQISTFTCVITTLYMPFYSNVISHERMDFFAYLSIFEAVSRIFVAVLIAFSPVDKMVFYATLLLLSQICIFVAYIMFSLRNFIEVKTALTVKNDLQLLKKMAGFSGWTLFVAVADLCAVQGINILINIFFTPVINAARGIAVQIQGAVDQFRGNLQTAFNPQITKRYASENMDGVYDLMGRSARYSSFVLLIISLPIIFSINRILEIWLTEVPPFTDIFVIITLIACIIDGISNPFVTAIGATGFIRNFQVLVGIMKFLTLPACYIGLLIYKEPICVFLVYLLFTVFTVLVRVSICSARINMGIKTINTLIMWPIVKFLIPSVIIMYGYKSLLLHDGFWSLLFFGFVSLSTLILVCFIFGLDNSERNYINRLLKEKL